MANSMDTILPKIFGAVAAREFFSEPRLSAAVRDHTAEAGVTASFSIPRFTLSAGIAEYKALEDISNGNLTDLAAEIQVNQHRYLSSAIDDLQRTQNFADAAMEAAVMQSRQLRDEYEAYLAGQGFEGAAVVNKLGGGSQASGTAKTPDATMRLAIVNEMFEAEAEAYSKSWPVNGRFAAMPYRWFVALSKWLAIDKPQTGAGELVRSAFANGMVLRVAGFEVLPTKGIADPKASTDDQNVILYGVAGETLRSIMQIRSAEVLRNPDQFGDIVRALFSYGCTVAHPDYALKSTIQTST